MVKCSESFGSSGACPYRRSVCNSCRGLDWRGSTVLAYTIIVTVYTQVCYVRSGHKQKWPPISKE